MNKNFTISGDYYTILNRLTAYSLLRDSNESLSLKNGVNIHFEGHDGDSLDKTKIEITDIAIRLHNIEVVPYLTHFVIELWNSDYSLNEAEDTISKSLSEYDIPKDNINFV